MLQMPTKNSRTLIAFSLVAVYFIWGSTYLALRFGLEGFPPFILNGLRFVVAGALMYIVLRIRGHAHPTRRQWWNAGRMGALLLIGGVGLVTIAEDFGVGSGIVATAAAAIPVWAALVSGMFGQWPVRREWVGLGAGLVGVLVLLQEGDFRLSTAGMVLVIVGPMFWAFGSVWGKRLEMPDGFMAPAAQLLVAGVVMLLASPFIGERIVEMPGRVAWLALGYLIVMGSIVAYTAYVYLLKTVRPSLATSYAYVNPAVAVFLGLTLGAEIITGPIFIALPLILAGVGLIATVKRSPQSSESTERLRELEPLEEAA
jgi:drug/metabolite transporter (DMT)-like permease